MTERHTSTFRVLIYDSEYRQIQDWTQKSPSLEIGGDLFGLWRDERTAVVQLVLGPGRNCHRTVTSFYQDVDYLDQVGNYLIRKEGLCHIGEWHSHHKLGLTRPSSGDDHTVYSNMQRYGINRFCLFISTINYFNRAEVNSFMYNIKEYKKQRNNCRITSLLPKSPWREKLAKLSYPDLSAWELKMEILHTTGRGRSHTSMDPCYSKDSKRESKRNQKDKTTSSGSREQYYDNKNEESTTECSANLSGLQTNPEDDYSGSSYTCFALCSRNGR